MTVVGMSVTHKPLSTKLAAALTGGVLAVAAVVITAAGHLAGAL